MSQSEELERQLSELLTEGEIRENEAKNGNDSVPNMRCGFRLNWTLLSRRRVNTGVWHVSLMIDMMNI